MSSPKRPPRVAPDVLGSETEFAAAYAIVESVLTKHNEPALGLRLHGANLRNLGHFNTRVGRGEITVTMLAILCVLDRSPGLSQTELARIIQVERMTAGVHAKRCVEKGLVVREKVRGDARRYALLLTTKGRRALRDVSKRIPLHEEHLASRLTSAERRQLIILLDKVGHD